MSDKRVEILERARLREKLARKQAEKVLEDKAFELHNLTGKLKESNNQLESLLAKKNLQLEGVFRNIADAYCVADMYGNVLEMNKASYNILDCDSEDKCRNINLIDFVHPEDASHLLTVFHRLKKHGEFKDLKIRIISNNRVTKHVHINASVILNDKGKPIAIQGIARDITSEFKTQKNLVKSENRLKALILNLDCGILLEDENCNIIVTNRKYCDLFEIHEIPEVLQGEHCSFRTDQTKLYFECPEEHVSRMQAIVCDREEVLGEELKMVNGKILERDFIPIYENENYKGHLWSYRDVTLSRNYSKNLEIEKQKYSGIIANMNLGLVEVDNNSKVALVNQSFSDITGYSEKELIGKDALGVLIPDADKEFMTAVRTETRTGKSQSFEMRMCNKEGHIRTVITSTAPNYDYNGKVVGSIGVILDITEQTRIKDQLIEQKKQLDLIVQNSPVGIGLFKKSGDGLLMVNKSFCDMFGYTEDELLNKVIDHDPTHPDDLEVSNKLRKQLQNGEIDNYAVEKRYIKRDGSIIWAKSNFNAIKDSKGFIKNQVAIIEDITAEREKTLMLETINNVAKSILGKIDIYEIAWEVTHNITRYLDSNDCVIYLVDKDSQVLRQIAAYGNKINENREVVNHLEIPVGEGLVGYVAQNGRPLVIGDTSLDKRYIQDDEFCYSEITVPIINDGEVLGVIDAEHIDKNYFTENHLSTLQNVARLVSLQLKNAINRIERNKAEQVNVNLLKELESSNNELQEYAHIVSHDLKSPLRSIFALVSWIKEDNQECLNEDSLTNISLIESTLEKMEQLISDILNYSSVSSQKVEDTPIDLNLVLKDIQKILFIPEHIKLSFKSNLPIIMGDHTRLQQLFLNLLSNAVRYIDKDVGYINVDVEEHLTHYQFSVQDNGIGIAKEYHDKIFKIFHTLNDIKESSGIGLSIVKKIVDMYHGDIWLESTVGIGTTFFFTLKK
ncbi:PAS domain S-box protein [Mariniflexile sp. AS56]|uniref:PAS domain S-box protein n=1 Tax=Mariniflexile sp. AS56 TaxID=3063957 RepID=UPI0026EA129F|nr:PAS domain S-box protein [Mariniflexile sp. AS56]MDO7171529.1 PAS domain S-box protein [Mariniflexile sp. AS56]